VEWLGVDSGGLCSNGSPGRAIHFLNLFIRQPIPTLGFLPAHMEAVIDLRNLLAQGYVPVMGQDGQTVYFCSIGPFRARWFSHQLLTPNPS